MLHQGSEAPGLFVGVSFFLYVFPACFAEQIYAEDRLQDYCFCPIRSGCGSVVHDGIKGLEVVVSKDFTVRVFTKLRRPHTIC